MGMIAITSKGVDMGHDSSERIDLKSHSGRVRIWAGDALIAETHRAIELRKTGYPPRLYIPREDVEMTRLRRSATTTHCPFKGDTTYYSVELDGETINDAAWSYEAPFEAVAPIRGRLAFDPELVRIQAGGDRSN
ncbi:MAG: DUF427 domain-containing protein [Methylohalobius sp. ZOD2]|nr:DUF427 domain-containing protein [Methylothermaceae bacterium]